MKKLSVCICLIFTFFLLSLTITPNASAVVRYTYTGNNFATAAAPYTTSMTVSGWFEMANQIPPNTSLTDIRTSITAYSFFDGVNMLTNANSGIAAFGGRSSFATDANGNITNWNLWVSSPVPASVGNPTEVIWSASFSDLGGFGNCTTLDAINICSTFGSVNIASNSATPGTWQMQIIADIVPTMNEWGMIIFMILAGLGATYFMRRKRITT